jgi:hypothetical protein
MSMSGSEESSGRRLSLQSAYPFAVEHGLGTEVEKIRSMEIEWDRSYTSTVRRGYIVKLLQSRGLFDEFRKKYWPFSLTINGETEVRRYLRIAEEYDSFLEGRGQTTRDVDGEEAAPGSEFAFETDLRDYLAANLDLIRRGLVLHSDERGSGVEYPVENGRIDILAKEQSNDFLVLELKVSQGRNKTLGQLLYYMAWVERNLAGGRRVRGGIIAKEIPEDLRLACSRIPDVSLYEYDLQVALRPIEVGLRKVATGGK